MMFIGWTKLKLSIKILMQFQIHLILQSNCAFGKTQIKTEAEARFLDAWLWEHVWSPAHVTYQDIVTGSHELF